MCVQTDGYITVVDANISFPSFLFFFGGGGEHDSTAFMMMTLTRVPNYPLQSTSHRPPHPQPWRLENAAITWMLPGSTSG